MSDVGSARVEVTGDVRNFARQTERELNAALSKMRIRPINIDVDIDRLDRSFNQAGGRAGGVLMDSLRTTLSGMGSVLAPVVSTAGAVIGASLAASIAAVVIPALAAAITGGLGLALGAGLIGLGAFALRDVKEFTDALSRVGDTLNEVGRRAAQPLLKPLVASLGEINKLIKSLEGDFRSIFAAMAPAIGPLTAALGAFTREALGGLKDAMPGIVAAFEGLSRALPEVGRWLGEFFRTVFSNSGLIDNTTEAITKLIFGPLKILGPLLSGLTVIFGALNNMISMSSTGWALIRDALINFVDAGTGALNRIQGAWGPLDAAIRGVWDTLKAFAGADTPAQIEQTFLTLVQSIVDAWEPLKGFLEVAWTEALAAIERIWNERFVPWWTETARPWLEEQIKAAFETAWDLAKAAVSERIEELKKDATGRIAGLPGAIAGALASLPGVVGRAFAGGVNAAITGAGQIVSGAIKSIGQLPGRITSTLNGVRQTVLGAFSGAASWLTNAGRQIINGLISGLRSGFDQVRNTLGSLTSMLPDWKGPPEVDRRILEASGRMVMEGFQRGMTDRFANVQRTLGDLTGDLPTWSGGRARGGDGAAAGSLHVGEIHVHVSGVTGEEAGEEAAVEILERLGQARGLNW